MAERGSAKFDAGGGLRQAIGDGRLRSFLAALVHAVPYRRFGWAFADQALVSAMNLLTALLLARFLGPEQFGYFTLAWIFVLLNTAFQTAIVTSPMMNIGPKQPAAARADYYASVFVLQGALATVCLFVLSVGIEVAGLLRPQWGTERFGLALPFAAVAHQLQDFVRRYFFTVGRPVAATVSDVVSQGGKVVAILLLFRQDGFDAGSVLWLSGAMSVLGVLVTFHSLEVSRLGIHGFRDTLARHWRFGKWLVASAGVVWATGNTLIIAAAAVLGAAEVGALKAAQNLLAVTHVLFLALQNVLPQQAAERLLRGGAPALARFLKATAAACLLPTVGVAALMLAAPDFWLTLFYGRQFATYGFLFQWLAISYVLTALTLPIQIGLGAIELTHPLFWTALLTTGLSLAVGLPMVERFGLEGVLIGTIANQLCAGVILFHMLRARLRRLPSSGSPA